MVARLFLTLTVTAWCCYLVASQVTFSRDWSPGKRNPEPTCAKHAASICQILVNELRQLAACEVKSLLRYHAEEVNVPQEIYIDGNGGR
ncbi:uncharacterized protein LOC126259927 [Schistocerca nitens]|uniref:uncharacterized protein LOC126259927 n=1 Tax=Schistocerca nitens TaxID=7011 RepID=UPI00211885C8|nr:uncharacterized protein LOC126259927 [Schistocerca nitens]